MNSAREAFLNWINSNVGHYSFLVEHFFTDCETESIDLRRKLLYKWILAAFEEGWNAAGGNDLK